MNRVVTRFAPSPTGYLHAGNYRTAVFAYLFAKREGGEFILRIEDTDKMRSRPEYEENIRAALAWLGLPFDRSYRQSEQVPRHRELLERLVAEGKARVSPEPAKDDPEKTVELVRFINPGGIVSFADMIRGEISMDVSDLGDFIIARSFDEPVFHFAVVVDDADEGVTQVIRGEDHISNTPRQILIQRALGVPTPAYAHLPLILGSDRTKLSKRRGAKALTEYRDVGILPEAMLNYLAFLGWNPGDDREYLSREELVASFDLTRVQKGSAIFDETKLFSVNQHWMRRLPDDVFAKRVIGNETWHSSRLLDSAIPLLKERARTFSEAEELLQGELACLFTAPALDRAALLAKEPADRSVAKAALESLLEPLHGLPEDVSAEAVKQALMPFADAAEAGGKGGRGAVLWPLRYALSGQERSPDPFTLISILGREESVSRIHAALAILN